MATTDIQPFASGGGANVTALATYLANTALLVGGFPTGAIPTAQDFNRILRQASFMSAGLAGFCVSQGVSVPDDGNLSALVTEITNAIKAANSMTGVEAFRFSSATYESGWLQENGQTIGPASSGATQTGTDFQALYNLLWANGTNATCPMLTSGGAGSTRGASAAADWAALKRLALPSVAHGDTLLSLTGTGGDLGTATSGQVIAHHHNWGIDDQTATTIGSGSPGHGTGGISTTSDTGGAKNAAAGQYRGLYIHI